MQILIVEDDKKLALALQQIVSEAGYVVDVVYNGNDGFDYARTGIYDAIVLDVLMPGKDGYTVASELRREGVSTPILLLTARDSVRDKITGLDSGADDYMTKPFAPAELLARLRALLRRQSQVVFETLSFGDVQLNLESHDVSCKEKSIHLGFKEFSILRMLMSNPNQIITKEQFIAKVWGTNSNAMDNNVEAYMSFLRKKLRFLDSCVSIESLRRTGYRIVMNANPQNEQ